MKSDYIQHDFGTYRLFRLLVVLLTGTQEGAQWRDVDALLIGAENAGNRRD